MRKEVVAMYLLSIVVMASIGCKDDKKPEVVEKEEFTVIFNNHEGGYEIVTCEEGEFVASDDELITTHLLDATASGRCYRVLFDFVDGFITPDSEKEYLTIGNPVEVEAEYEVIEYTEKVTVSCSIPGGKFVIYTCSDNTPVGFGPHEVDGCLDDTSFILPAHGENPGFCYKTYFTDVAGYMTPGPGTIHLVAGHPEYISGQYTPNGTGG